MSCKDRGALINLCLVCPNGDIWHIHDTSVKTQTLTSITTNSTTGLNYTRR